MARRSTQPRELVRLTPLQFSLAVSIVVLLAAGSGLAGYLYGYRKAMEKPETVQSPPAADQGVTAPSGRPGVDSQAPVTFYTTLTEQREHTPAKRDPPATEAPGTASPPISTSTPAPAVETSAAVARSGAIMLQVASYGKREAASRLLESLGGEGYAGTVVRADLGDRGVWYRVRIGPYGGEKEAGRVLKKLREERNLKGFVVNSTQ
ncbi:MAG: SPOR domain-containing protein [bacterium]|nr:SPOR domain-containing protein [bacterium]